MRELSELLDTIEPAFPLTKQWACEAEIPVELLHPSAERGNVLLKLQVTTRSPLGAIAYETGGILVDDGWLRLLGAGSPRLERDIASWNEGKTDGLLLFGDDVLGGFFAVNGGALGSDLGNVYYLAPETLEWEPLGIGFTAFVQWAFTSELHQFYGQHRREDINAEARSLSGQQCFNFYPFLWTEEGSSATSSRRPIPVAEQWALNSDLRQQLQESKLTSD
jgi:hypothetical protein